MTDLFVVFGNILRMCVRQGYEIPASIDAMYRVEAEQRRRGLGETLNPITSHIVTGKQQGGTSILFRKAPEFPQAEADLVLVFFAGESEPEQVSQSKTTDEDLDESKKAPLIPRGEGCQRHLTNRSCIDAAIRQISENRMISEVVIIVQRDLTVEALEALRRLRPSIHIVIFRESDLMDLV